MNAKSLLGKDLVEDEQQNPKQGKSIVTMLLASSLIILIIALGASIATILFSVETSNNLEKRKDTIVDKIIKEIVNGSMKYILPTRFSVHKNYLTPPTDQMHRGTCWDFSATYILESQYRYQGIERGYLKENEYVNFSKQALGAWLGQECIKTGNKSKACKHGGFAQHSTSDHKADSLYYFVKDFPELARSILPEAVCPYIADEGEETDYSCPGMEESLKTNPIEFKVKGIRSASTVQGAKRLLAEAQRPLTIGAPLPSIVYHAPCDQAAYSGLGICSEERSVRCPSGYASERCGVIKVEGRMPDGTFFLVDDFNRTKGMGGHAMNVVGYNDEWIYRSRFSTPKSIADLRGGFILHNSWRSAGHSVEFLMGRRSWEEEDVVCPNHGISSNWIPGSEECLREAGGDVAKCANPLVKYVRGKGLQGAPDVLKCTNGEFCDTGRRYALLEGAGGQPDVQPLFSGLDRVRVGSWRADGSDFRAEVIQTHPFNALHEILKPTDETLVGNEAHECGFYVLPYAAVEMMARKTWSKLDTFHVADIELEFTDSSYERGPIGAGKDAALLKKSTWEFEPTKFDGPLPYQYVY